jgi:hypothetical protein
VTRVHCKNESFIFVMMIEHQPTADYDTHAERQTIDQLMTVVKTTTVPPVPYIDMSKELEQVHTSIKLLIKAAYDDHVDIIRQSIQNIQQWKADGHTKHTLNIQLLQLEKLIDFPGKNIEYKFSLIPDPSLHSQIKFLNGVGNQQYITWRLCRLEIKNMLSEHLTQMFNSMSTDNMTLKFQIKMSPIDKLPISNAPLYQSQYMVDNPNTCSCQNGKCSYRSGSPVYYIDYTYNNDRCCPSLEPILKIKSDGPPTTVSYNIGCMYGSKGCCTNDCCCCCYTFCKSFNTNREHIKSIVNDPIKITVFIKIGPIKSSIARDDVTSLPSYDELWPGTSTDAKQLKTFGSASQL